METCSVVLTFESIDEILRVTIQMKPLRQHFWMVQFLFFFFSVFFNTLQNETLIQSFLEFRFLTTS